MKRRPTRQVSPLLPEIMVGVTAGFACLIVIVLLPSLRTLGADQIFNLAEGLLWTAIAVSFFVRCRKFPAQRKLMLGAAASFLLFGISDFIEIRTRAWYEPLMLFAFKAACVISLVIHYFLFWRQKSRRHESPAGQSQTQRPNQSA